MQRSKACLVALSLIALAVAPSLAAAGTFGAEVYGGFNTYSMSDVNDITSDLNTTSGTNFDKVSSGLSVGLGLRTWANQSWLISASWEPLFANTESSSTSQKVNLDANTFSVSGTYFMPSTTNAKYGFGAGVGYYSISGETEDPTATPTTSKIEGSGAGFHLAGVGEWTVNKNWAFTGSAGYRIASIEMKDENGNKVQTPTGDNATADYSGFIGRAGVVMYFPSSKSK
ncbi:MAG TPA: outer membrane beta-barrel protein [Candidatus Eisenbacteria bacterium]